MRSRTMPARPATRSNVKAPELGPIASYKAILKDYIDRRPAGMRARIASELGKQLPRALDCPPDCERGTAVPNSHD